MWQGSADDDQWQGISAVSVVNPAPELHSGPEAGDPVREPDDSWTLYCDYRHNHPRGWVEEFSLDRNVPAAPFMPCVKTEHPVGFTCE